VGYNNIIDRLGCAELKVYGINMNTPRTILLILSNRINHINKKYVETFASTY
jgi:hypothetical protein